MNSACTMTEIALTDHDDRSIPSESVPELFAAHFSEVAHVLDAKIPLNNVHPNSYLNERISSNFFAYPSTSAEVFEIIMSLQKKSSPTNEIPLFLYKTFCNDFSAYISELFNRSLVEGIFPSCLKTSKVIPIFKSGKRDKVVNYRPISILLLLSKVFEKLMYNRLVKFLNKNNILTDRHFGFRSKLNTSDAITQFLSMSYHCLDNQKNLIAIFLDFSKAFDTVNHDILLNKLYIYGVRGKILS